MADPRGIVQVHVLGRKRRLRGTLAAGIEAQRRCGRSLIDVMQSIETDVTALQTDALVIVFEEFCRAGGDPVEPGALDDLLLGDVPDIVQAVNECVEASGLIDANEESAPKNRAARRRRPTSPGGAGKKSRSGT